ncbi:MAG TPA: HIT family protein [Candidatus Aenigmarchaeota archaeon]|nr:MAG: HIT family protein [Candidatus Aenigmarchaeota archaeon]HDD45997.1 HIT family protein [Candidatus Aenigmarchaeota archaeon]
MEECLFCKIVAGQIPAEKVYEDSDVIAFLDINPRNPGHTLVIPKKHFSDLLEMDDEYAMKLFVAVKRIAKAIKDGIKADGISISQSNGRAAGQVVNHMHVHVIPRFFNEGPVGLESILPTKKIDQGSMKNISNILKEAISKVSEVSKPASEKKEMEFEF